MPTTATASTSPHAPPAGAAAPKVTIAWAGDLPALPAAVLDLLALVAREDLDVDELCARLSVDIALTAKILRLANSAFYGARGEVTSVDAAVARLGLRMIKGIVTAAAASASIKPPDCPGFDFDAFWRHGVATATAAQMLAFATGVDSTTAFTSGLLYRVGQLVLAAQAPDHYAQVIAYRAALGGEAIEVERQLLGVDHATVGARIAAHWRLPAAIVEALAQKDGALAAGRTPTLGQVAGAADRLIDALETGADPAAAGPGAALAAWEQAGAPPNLWASAARDASRQAEAICAALIG